MPSIRVNGVDIHYEDAGAGEPLVLVHGSWVDAQSWKAVMQPLASEFRVVAYDRRGHSRSERPRSQGSLAEDAADLSALLEALDAVPANLVGNSYGGVIVLALACERPAACASVAVHEPPAVSLLAGDPQFTPMLEQMGAGFAAVVEMCERGEHEAAARNFAEMALGEGAWERDFDEATRQAMVVNAPTFVDETRDPTQLNVDLDALARYGGPVLLTLGSESPPMYGAVLDALAAALPRSDRHTFEGAGHVPHATQPDAYAERIAEFARATASS